jgi:pimeloyl-ACP methyl ester carboxylesterase
VTDEAIVEVGRGIELCYDAFGDDAAPPVVLIAGLGQQKHSWPEEMATNLAERGYRAIRFDNRDAGRSTHASFPRPRRLAVLRGGSDTRQYHLGDMARDTVGLLDALGYHDAHLVGVFDGRHDRPDRRGASSGPGANAHLDHVDHRCAAHRPSGIVDVVADGDRETTAEPS